VKQAFRNLRSAEAAFCLMEKFRELKSRPAINKCIEDRYLDALKQYTRELATIEGTFRLKKGSPPVCKTSTPVAASISWAMDLYKRAKTPMLKFKKYKGMLDTGFGRKVKKEYLSFARSIDAYKNGNIWCHAM
jgi:dynein heavy chain